MPYQEIKPGDVCIYSYDNKNKSITIVEVVEELSEETVVVKFHQVIYDDSGNDLFHYLCSAYKPMNVSKKYLTKIDIVNKQRATIKRLTKYDEERDIRLHAKLTHRAKVEAINDYVDRLKSHYPHSNSVLKTIDAVKQEMVGENNAK